MNNAQLRKSVPYWNTKTALRERYAALEGLMAYASQQCDRFIFTDRRTVLYELVDLINTDEGKKIVDAWYANSLHTLTLIQHVTENIDTHNDRLVSSTYHALNIELERLTAQVIAELHPAAQHI